MLVAFVLLAASALLVDVPAAQAGQALPYPVPGEARSVTVPFVRLGATESVSFGLHPTEGFVALSTRSTRLEVCKAFNDLTITTDCVAFGPGRPAEVPVPNGHIFLLVRASEDSAVQVRDLRLDYSTQDSFFVLVPPSRRTPTLVVTPTRVPTVAVQVLDFPAGVAVDAGSLVVRQRGKRLEVERRSFADGVPEGTAYGPAEVDLPVSIRFRKESRGAGSQVGIYVQWS